MEENILLSTQKKTTAAVMSSQKFLTQQKRQRERLKASGIILHARSRRHVTSTLATLLKRTYSTTQSTKTALSIGLQMQAEEPMTVASIPKKSDGGIKS